MPEWYETNSKSFQQSEAQSVSIFVHHMLNDSPGDQSQKANGLEGDLSNLVKIHLSSYCTYLRILLTTTIFLKLSCFLFL